jgi:hypothetical protein
MRYQTNAFADILRLTTPDGRVPKEIPEHYWQFCWAMRRRAMGNPVPSVGARDVATRSKPIKLPTK